MDIDRATKRALSALTFDERPLAQDLFSSQSADKQHSTVWVRAPSYTLSTALADARSVAKKAGFTARFINIYCDTLRVSQDVITSETDNSGVNPYFNIQFFVRKIESPSSTGTASLTFNMTKGSEVTFWTPSIPSAFTVDFKLPGDKTSNVKPVVSPGNFGVSFACTAASLSSEQWEPPEVALKNIDYLSLIKEDGTLKEKQYLSDDLPRLLQFQMLVAQANITLDRPLALELLAYVIVATNSPYSAFLNYQACSLRSSLSLNADVMAVSSVNVYSSKQILKARLAAALAFEQAFRRFALESNSTKIQAAFAVNLLAKSKDALETYEFLIRIRQRDYDNAITANSKASVTFKKNQADLVTLEKAFQTGIEKFQKEQKWEAAKGILKSVVGAAIAIGAIVVTAGAAAPLAAPAAVGAVGAATKVAQLIAKLKSVFDRLKKIYDKIKPVLEKIQEVVKTVSEVIDAIKKFDAATADAKTLKPNTQSNDVYNVTAEWQNFDITVREMEDSLREYAISGKQEYFHALKTIVNNGQAYILTQANLVQRGDELATVLLQRKMEDRDQGRLEKLTSTVETDKSVLDLLKRAMFDRLLAIRSLVFLDFYTYSSAYNYHTLHNESVVSLSPVKPVVDYLEDAAKLQGAVVSFGSTTRIQSRVFTVETLCGFDSAQELGSKLTTDNLVAFTISPQEQIWQGFSRIRMSSARCYLDGAKWKPDVPESRPLRLQLKTDGQFFDIDMMVLTVGETAAASSSEGAVLTNSVNGDTNTTAAQQTVPVTRSFVGDPRQLLFEYTPNTGAILCDGQWGQLRDYTKQTPMTNWELSIAESNSLDLSALQGVRMEFECEVIWRGY